MCQCPLLAMSVTFQIGATQMELLRGAERANGQGQAD